MFKGTTVICIRKNGKVAMGSDGQVTMEPVIVKKNAKKIRKLYGGKILAGFSGSTADALSLLERFERKLEAYGGNLLRASVELAKDWRTDKVLRRLEALLLVANKNTTLLISGTGDVVEPEENIAAIGSGGPYARAAAKALMEHTDMDAKDIAKESLRIAADICLYTNENIVIEELE